MSMFRRAAFTAVLAAVFVAAGASGATTTAPAAASAAPCDWATEFDTALAALDEQRADWHVIQINPDNWAQTLIDERQVEFSPDVPCRMVADIVKHEWMHLQQARMHGNRAQVDAAYDNDPTVLEYVADCGAQLLGATELAYIDHRGWKCSRWAVAQAQLLIDHR